ncbi:MAG: HAMP domain-containing protein [Phycisphaerales bacterium]|nr:HAMP domain-containing protein [Phycisphaerales bacterium]
MQLRTKITLAFLLLFAAFIAGDYLVERHVTFKRFRELEEQLARANLDRWEYAVEREIVHLAEFAGDWTNWDDAYDFTQTGNHAFIESNLSSEDWFRSFNLPVLAFYNARGEAVWSRCADAQTGQPVDLPALEAAIHTGDRPLAVDDDRPAASGIISTSRGLLLVASRAIYRTDGSGPAQGFALFGRFLDDELAASIAKQTLVRGAVEAFDPANAGQLNPDLHTAILRSDHDTVLRPVGGVLRAYSLLRDARGEPVILIRSDTPSVITTNGNYALWTSIAAMGGAGLATLALQFAFVHMIVVRPLQRLIRHARSVGASGDLTSRLGRFTNDEIGDLGAEFDTMVGRLADSRGELVAQSRATGQAEIASSVTHNLGNVLNSAGVAISSLRQHIEGLRTDGAAKIADLIDEHHADIETFLRNDPRGTQLPKYLRTLSDHLRDGRHSATDELRRLEEQIRHMQEIIGSQRELARRASYSEVVLPREIVDRAIKIVSPSFARHHIEVQASIPDLEPIRTDPVQVVQILVNLLTNAKDAMQGVGEADRRVSVTATPAGAHLAIEVQDTGPGIDPDAAERLFQAGYSTKGPGRGLGLHFCAIAAGQLGGTLEARNALGRAGAVFTLRIPAARVGQELAAA